MTPAERAALIDQVEGPKIKALVIEAAKLAGSRAPFGQVAERFIDIADSLSRAITPHTPCGSGCSHCCHMATALSGYEAAMIGRYTGRVPVPQHRHAQCATDAQARMLEQFTGVPCTFLDAGRCTIYPVRPIACRVHHSMNDTPDDCRIIPHEVARAPGYAPPKVPRINLTAFINVQALAFLPDDFGDIREFFP